MRWEPRRRLAATLAALAATVAPIVPATALPELPDVSAAALEAEAAGAPALGAVAGRRRRVALRLTQALGEQLEADPWVEEELCQLGDDAAAAVIAALGEGHPRPRALASVLRRLPASPALVPQLRRLLWADAPEVASAAAAALASLGPEAAPAYAELASLACSPVGAVEARAAAVWALARVGGDDALRAVASLAADGGILGDAALGALAVHLPTPIPAGARQALADRLRDPGVPQAIRAAIARCLGGDDQSDAVLLAAWFDNPPTEVALALLEGLCRRTLGRRPSAPGQHLVAEALEAREPRVRAAACLATGELRLREYRVALEERLLDPAPEVAYAARRGLAALGPAPALPSGPRFDPAPRAREGEGSLEASAPPDLMAGRAGGVVGRGLGSALLLLAAALGVGACYVLGRRWLRRHETQRRAAVQQQAAASALAAIGPRLGDALEQMARQRTTGPGDRAAPAGGAARARPSTPPRSRERPTPRVPIPARTLAASGPPSFPRSAAAQRQERIARGLVELARRRRQNLGLPMREPGPGQSTLPGDVADTDTEPGDADAGTTAASTSQRGRLVQLPPVLRVGVGVGAGVGVASGVRAPVGGAPAGALDAGRTLPAGERSATLPAGPGATLPAGPGATLPAGPGATLRTGGETPAASGTMGECAGGADKQRTGC